MRVFRTVAWSALVLTVAGLATASAARADEDEKGVSEANSQFYAALNAMFTGDVEPMQAAWSHADDVTYMGPSGGMQVGWQQVQAIWQQQAAKKLGGTVKPEMNHANVGQDLAVVGCYEVGENVVDGEPQHVQIRATNVFRKENGEWKMIGHHTDLLPFLDAGK